MHSPGSIDDIYDTFNKGMIINTRNKDFSLNFLENKLQEIKKSYYVDDVDINHDEELSIENLIFYSWEDSKIISFSKENITWSMLIKGIINHQNKQYQWHLVSAFEDYEKF